jgi:hypothetical protein
VKDRALGGRRRTDGGGGTGTRAWRTIAMDQAALMLRAAGDDRRRGPAIRIGPEG